jgi:hypothetical protein
METWVQKACQCNMLGGAAHIAHGNEVSTTGKLPSTLQYTSIPGFIGKDSLRRPQRPFTGMMQYIIACGDKDS